jgi:hypothetical protein
VSTARTPVPRREPRADGLGGGQRVRLASELVHELTRLFRHPVHELARLEDEASTGESPATPLILIVGIAMAVWAFVALVLALVLLSAHLIAA